LLQAIGLAAAPSNTPSYHLSTPKGWKADLGFLADLYSGRFTHKVVTCTLHVCCIIVYVDRKYG